MADYSTHIKPQLSRHTMHIYWVKSSILNALKESLPSFKGSLLDVGCGNQPYREFLTNGPSKVTEYIGLDIEYPFASTKPDLYWEGRHIPMPDNSVDTVILTEVLEHCPEPEQVLREIERVLRPDGILFFTVPFLWMLHEAPHDEFRYTPFALRRLLKNAAFKSIELKSLGGWNASLAQMMGLWLVYKQRSKWSMRLLKLFLYPFFIFLVKSDRSDHSFPDLSMITGVSGTARK